MLVCAAVSWTFQIYAKGASKNLKHEERNEDLFFARPFNSYTVTPKIQLNETYCASKTENKVEFPSAVWQRGYLLQGFGVDGNCCWIGKKEFIKTCHMFSLNFIYIQSTIGTHVSCSFRGYDIPYIDRAKNLDFSMAFHGLGVQR